MGALGRGAPVRARSVLAVIDHHGSWRETVARAGGRAMKDGARLTIVGVARFQKQCSAGMNPVCCSGPLQPELDQEAADLVRKAVALVPDKVPITTIVRRGSLGSALRRELRGELHQVVHVRRLRGPGWLQALMIERIAGGVEIVASADTSGGARASDAHLDPSESTATRW